MFGKLSGIVDSIEENLVLLNVGGAGYEIFCASRTLSALEPGAAAALIIETHVREDHIHLYGFASREERQWFRELMTVKGVGAKTALSILSVLAPPQLIAAIQAQDKASFTQISGIGTKGAERILTELKQKAASHATSNITLHPAAKSGGKSDTTLSDVVTALSGLGFNRVQAYTIAASLLSKQPSLSAEELIRLSLKELAA